MLSTILPALLSISLLASTTTALPAASPAELVPRACTTKLPHPIDVLDKTTPNKHLDGSVFRLERTDSVNDVSSVVTFKNIPAGSTGCTLAVIIPPHTPGQIATGTATQADVWTVAADPKGTSTWNKQPEKKSVVSTVIFPAPGSTETFATNLWAGNCDSTLSFLFELSNWQQGNGSVSFINSETKGFSLIYDC
jgi:hypothetical protein